MKQLKLAILIIMLAILQSLASVHLGSWGIFINVLFAFTVAFSVYEKDFIYVMVTAIVCGVTSVSISDSDFLMTVLMHFFSAMFVHMTYDGLKVKIPFLKVILMTLLLSFIGEGIIYFLINLKLSWTAVGVNILPKSLCNAAAAGVLYKVLKEVFKEKEVKFIKFK